MVTMNQISNGIEQDDDKESSMLDRIDQKEESKKDRNYYDNETIIQHLHNIDVQYNQSCIEPFKNKQVVSSRPIENEHRVRRHGSSSNGTRYKTPIIVLDTELDDMGISETNKASAAIIKRRMAYEINQMFKTSSKGVKTARTATRRFEFSTETPDFSFKGK